LRAGDEAPGAPARSWWTPSAARREIGHACLAFALYLILYPIWMLGGAHDIYSALVRGLGGRIVLATQHFPVFQGFDRLKVSYLDFAIILCVAYALLPGPSPVLTRLRRYGGLAAVIFVFHVLGFVLETYMDSAADLLSNLGLPIFLPWEIRILDGARYLLIDLGLNVWPFIVILAGAVWHSGIDLRRAPTVAEERRAPRSKPAAHDGPRMLPRPRRLSSTMKVCLAAGVALCPALGTWGHLRESDPRHVQAHVLLGHLFLRQGLRDDALEQYEIATRHGSTDGGAWLNSATIQFQHGRTREAGLLIRQALDVVSDAAWRSRLTDLSAQVSSGS
jgi:hypothetical protein